MLTGQTVQYSWEKHSGHWRLWTLAPVDTEEKRLAWRHARRDAGWYLDPPRTARGAELFTALAYYTQVPRS